MLDPEWEKPDAESQNFIKKFNEVLDLEVLSKRLRLLTEDTCNHDGQFSKHFNNDHNLGSDLLNCSSGIWLPRPPVKLKA